MAIDRLTPDQLSAFYARIRLPPSDQHLPGPALTSILSSPAAALDLLSSIQRHAVCALPFENLSLHYSLHKQVHINVPFLFDKMVTRDAGRGGYCMELNALLLAALLGMGFDAVPMGAKASESIWAEDHTVPRAQLKWDGWDHMVLVVTLGGRRYLVDIGFGGGNPTGPMELVEGKERLNVPGSEDGEGRPHMLRLVRDTVEGNEMWALDRLVRGKNLPEEGAWRPFYAFPEIVFTPGDFKIMNHYVSTARDSLFTNEIVCVMSILAEDGKAAVGDMAMFKDGAKKRMYGKEVETRKLEGEKDRIKLLEEWFGIRLTEVEQEGIQGLGSMLR